MPVPYVIDVNSKLWFLHLTGWASTTRFSSSNKAMRTYENLTIVALFSRRDSRIILTLFPVWRQANKNRLGIPKAPVVRDYAVPTIWKQRVGFFRGLLASAGVLAFAVALLQTPGKADAQTAPAPADHQQFLTRYCQGCHNDRAKTGGLSVQPLKVDNLAAN